MSNLLVPYLNPVSLGFILRAMPIETVQSYSFRVIKKGREPLDGWHAFFPSPKTKYFERYGLSSFSPHVGNYPYYNSDVSYTQVLI